MSTNLYRTCSKVSILIKPSISLAFTLELGLLIATTVPMPYCLADLRVTNLASYFDGIISSHDYDVAKEKQEFWQKLEDEIKFDKAKIATSLILISFLAKKSPKVWQNTYLMILRTALGYVWN
jgi:hypothetical protein